VLENIQAAAALNQESGHPLSRQTDYEFLANFYHCAGTLDQAARWADALYALRESLMPVFLTSFFTTVARVKIACGKLDQARAILDQMLEEFDWDASWSNTVIIIAIADGHLQLAQGKPERVFDRLGERVQEFRRAGFLYTLSEELWLRGKADLALGKVEEAKKALRNAKALAEGKNERAILRQILVTLAELEGKCGGETEAKKLRRQAGEIVAYIAGHAGSQELRASFLAQPAVARILSEI
jgi:tetratricopeptide (TPR) repeat protein